MSKICMQLDKNFVVSEDFIKNLLLKKDFFVDEISIFFDLGFLETDTSSDHDRGPGCPQLAIEPSSSSFS